MHDVRVAYLVCDNEKKIRLIKESEFLPEGGCPITGRRAPAEDVRYSPLRFGWMFKARNGFPPDLKNDQLTDELLKVARCLIQLGKCMDDPLTFFSSAPGSPAFAAAKAAAEAPNESAIPAGYTYLGQFITHEITFHNTERLPLFHEDIQNGRSPSLDLDSLYGAGPDEETPPELYEAGPHRVRLKVGWTQPPPAPPTDSSQRSFFPVEFQNDLPRKAGDEEDKNKKQKREAIIGDERNDENLPLAQTHVAFLKFHNRVVKDLEEGRYKDFPSPAPEELFDKAREEVVKHFQWVVLKDYLPKLVGENLVKSLTRKPSGLFDPEDDDLFIPLEFSAAAFRIGHSMVRRRYKWNDLHKTKERPDVAVSQLFTNTKRSGNLGGLDRLDSTWVIDWKNFYDFTPFASEYPRSEKLDGFNRAGRLDTTFGFRLERIAGFQHLPPPKPTGNNGGGEKPDEKKSANHLFNGEKEVQALPVRNLLRGLALGLQWGEDVAQALVKEGVLQEAECLNSTELRTEPHATLLAADALGGKTPLWFYVLKEAEVKGQGDRLGPVGGHIVAETLIGLIRHSRYKLLRPVEGAESEWELSDWRPAYGRHRDAPDGVQFEMVDLLRAADVVDPVGEYLRQTQPHP